MNKKLAKESYTEMNELVLPNDTNTFGNLMGGRLLYWMDICAAMAAQKHSNSPVVTVSVDNVSFRRSIRLGEVVTIQAQVTRAFSTSMEVRMEIFAQNLPEGTKVKSNEAYYTFVAIDKDNKPTRVPELVPETDTEKELFEKASQRRELRLILGGKLKPEHAVEIQNLVSIATKG
ncbi:acyl-CoA hydrolase [Sphingobacterium allocomposti]|jgi:acyl-CoA hydrolase|uniref:Acyl-CoA hydrolase n=1 Tax=Sphingobacterium allocomposti TaxID=415956 RepID=A0A5S5DUE7_9SPHI|nr:acyl-CoA thioesterase [Sphingobacterium composti Yoo et al. 2007 non Ten et al. 2007]TYP98636.1 acyl-CoA hydrolase [Sphingobacterium composti Yoo et al. 2007 non Ten et al. 2007]HLS95371.1 acyl-CoA thioesterase [Sphingobacterium sp.]